MTKKLGVEAPRRTLAASLRRDRAQSALSGAPRVRDKLVLIAAATPMATERGRAQRVSTRRTKSEP